MDITIGQTITKTSTAYFTEGPEDVVETVVVRKVLGAAPNGSGVWVSGFCTASTQSHGATSVGKVVRVFVAN